MAIRIVPFGDDFVLSHRADWFDTVGKSAGFAVGAKHAF
jgi:hypothetical protein